jgi:N-acetylmuramoyl-L-alanine amidase
LFLVGHRAHYSVRPGLCKTQITGQQTGLREQKLAFSISPSPFSSPSRFLSSMARSHPSSITRRSAGIALPAWLGALVSSGGGKANAKDEWTIIKYNGGEYVADKNVHAFYRFETFAPSGNDRVFRSKTVLMRWKVGTQDIYINNIKFSLSFPVVESGGKALISVIDLAKLIDPVLRPKYIQRKNKITTVVIDPGHGAHDSGAKGVYGYEKDYALSLGLRLRKTLEARGFKIKMTRSTDTFLSLNQRVAYANKVDNAIFVSVHFNSSGNRSASGIETYALAPQGTASTNGGGASGSTHNGNVRDAENIALATAVHAMVIHRINAIDRGIKRARFNVLRGINKPAILFEGGFITNSSEGRKIHTEAYLDQLASSIAEAIVRFQTVLGGK